LIVTAAISVIIPTLNEAAQLPSLLATIAREKTPHEVIVVDGGSADGSLELASNLGARILHAPGGRGAQLAAGARAATGDVLLFLHADTVFPEGGLAAIVSALAAPPDCIGGNFRLWFDGADPFSRRLTGFYHWMRRRGLYYGDSGIFVRHDSYRGRVASARSP
jgi:glycosyltransferase involved in cell wall biosynthesis